MVLDGGKRQYKVVREVFSGEKNDVFVCMDLCLEGAEYKTAWRVKDREITKKLLGAPEIWEDSFVKKEHMYFVFPYREERPMEKFYFTTVMANSLKEESIWLDFAVRCMTFGIPNEILYLLLKQKQAGITPEGKVYFNYFLDLSEYGQAGKEQDCAMLCAGEILALAKAGGDTTGSSTELLKQKLGRKAYGDFFQLYQDLRLMADRQEKKNFFNLMKDAFVKKRVFFYRCLCVSCLIIVLSGAGVFFFQAFFGETVLHRIFGHTFEKIGTESLLQ